MIYEQGQKWSNISATPPNFVLAGGLYQINVVATWGGGSVTLNQVAADGSTLLSVAVPFTVNGGATVYLPGGTYQLTIATATAVYAQISRIPLE